MDKLTQKQVEDLKYLRNLDRIIIPSEFTYWCHNTMYKPKEDCVSYSDKRCWNEIPTHSFVLKSDMSFLTRVQRVNSALDYGNLPSVNYANTPNSLPFQIRVLQPKQKYIKEIYADETTRKKHDFYHRGLGDGRHPKLPIKMELYVFAFSLVDDVSNQSIDIVYCIDKDDISLIADLVRKVSKDNISAFNKNLRIVNNRAFEDDVPIIIAKCNNISRYVDVKIVNKDGKCDLVKIAGYKQDYKKIKEKNINKK